MNALRTLFAAALMTLSASATAQIYLFGMGSHWEATTRTTPDTSGSETTGMHLGIGWRFSPHLAAEVAYFSTGHFGSADGLSQWSADGFGIAAVGTMPLSGPWSLVGKLGAYDLKDDFTSGGARTKTGLGTRPLVAIGGQYYVGDALYLQFLYQQINGKDDSKLERLRLISLGAVLQF